MEKYEKMGLVGEGSYGMVLKCKHKDTGQLFAIKQFIESEDDKMVRKIAMREIKMLKLLRHDNLVNLIEVFRRKKRLYLVFEFVDHTLLDELEKYPNGLEEIMCRRILWQVLCGTEFCHLHNIIHRDIKPENILVSKTGVVKICDFGFARTMAQPGEAYTDYVATRWYRAPELLVGDTRYGKAVDIWAVGCLLAEMLTGDPLFPGDSDIDQLYHITKCFGSLPTRHKEVFLRNPLFVGVRMPEANDVKPLNRKLRKISPEALDFMKHCLKLNQDSRPICSELLKHDLFVYDGFSTHFPVDLKQRIDKDSFLSSPHKNTTKKTSIQAESGGHDMESTSMVCQAAGTVISPKKKKRSDVKETSLAQPMSKVTKDVKKQNLEESKKKAISVEASPAVSFTGSSVFHEGDVSSEHCLTVTIPSAAASGTKEVDGAEKAADSSRQPQHGTTASTSAPQSIGSTIPPIIRPAPTVYPSPGQVAQHSNQTSKGMNLEKYHSKKNGLKKGLTGMFTLRNTSFSPIHPDKHLLQEKIPLRDKLNAARSTDYADNIQQEVLTLPEVRGLSDGNGVSRKELLPIKKSTVAFIPDINSTDTSALSKSTCINNFPDQER